MRQLRLENQPPIVSSIFRQINAPRILSILDQVEDIEKSIELSEASGYNFEKFKRKHTQEAGKFKTLKDYLALKEISLTVNQGELVCLTGKQGSGKTTLIQSILGETLFIDNETLGRCSQVVTELIISLYRNL